MTRVSAALGLTAAALQLASAAVVDGLLPRAAFQQVFNLPLAGAAAPSEYNLIMVADAGHDVALAASGICDNLGRTFNASAYVAKGAGGGASTTSPCEAEVAARARLARGLHLAHDEAYATLATALEEALAGAGHRVASLDGPTLYAKPYRAAFLVRLASELAAAGAPPATVCETGFGAGHSALLWAALSRPVALAGGRTSTPRLPRPVTVHAFDTGLSKATLAGHDWLDARWPAAPAAGDGGALYLYLGDSFVTVPQMGDYFPQDRCQVVYLDGSPGYDSVAADLRHFRDRAAPGAVVVLAGARPGSDALRAWTDAAGGAAPLLAWEGTLPEAQQGGASPDGGVDALVYGRYRAA